MYFSVLKANVYKYFITLLRAYPKDFFIGNTLTLCYSLLFSYLLYQSVFDKSLDDSFVSQVGSSNYLGYVVIGILMYSFTVSTLLNVSRSLITEKRMGTLESVMLAPYNRGMYFLAYMFAQVIHTILELLFALPILLILKVQFQSFNLLEFLVVFGLMIFSFLGLSLLLANVMLYTSDTYISQNTLFTFMFLICEVNFPITYLPKFVGDISNFIPLTHVIELFRVVLLRGESIWQYQNNIIYLILTGTIYTMAGFMMLSRIEKIALENIQ